MTQLTNCLVVWISEVKKWQKKTLRWSYKYISRIHKIRNFVLKVVNPWKFKMSWFSKVSLIHARTFSGTALFWANRARKAPLRCWRRCFLAARSSSSSMISAVAGPILLFLSINHFRCLGIIKNKYCSLCDTPEKRCHISVLIFFCGIPMRFLSWDAKSNLWSGQITSNFSLQSPEMRLIFEKIWVISFVFRVFGAAEIHATVDALSWSLVGVKNANQATRALNHGGRMCSSDHMPEIYLDSNHSRIGTSACLHICIIPSYAYHIIKIMYCSFHS